MCESQTCKSSDFRFTLIFALSDAAEFERICRKFDVGASKQDLFVVSGSHEIDEIDIVVIDLEQDAFCSIVTKLNDVTIDI